ncbi:MAG: hypothetical protein QM749_05065 [Aquabacterium sp.]
MHPQGCRWATRLRSLQAKSLAHREYEHTPLFEIQRWAGQGSESLFDTILVFETYPIDEALLAQGPPARCACRMSAATAVTTIP